MKTATVHTVLNFLIATVWIANGLFCKVLGLVPRHEQIVSRILGDDFSAPVTIAIGVLELLMALWILIKKRSRECAITQMVTVAAMNVIEFVLVPDLLLLGQINVVLASMFVGVVYYNEFSLSPQLTQPS